MNTSPKSSTVLPLEFLCFGLKKFLIVMASPYKESQEGVFRLSGPIELDEHNRTTSIFNILGRDEESLKPGSPMALRGLRSRRYARKPTPRELYYSDMPCLTLGPSVGFSNPSTTLNSRELDGLASPSDETLNPLARLGSSAPLSADFASNICPELLSGNSDVAMPRKRRKVSSIYSHTILQPICK